MAHYFITGTDTNCGKTYVTCLLLRWLQKRQRRVVGYKPIACGDRMDAHFLRQHGSDPALNLEEINPVFFKMAASPFAASLIEPQTISLDSLEKAYQNLRARYDHVLVEGAGGWEVPLTAEWRISHLAQRLNLPVILVAANRLGALNHILLTVQAIERAGLRCHGIILNHVNEMRDAASISHRALLSEMQAPPVIGEVMHGDDEIDLMVEL